LAACRAHGIKPEPPSYYAPGIVIELEAADSVGLIDGPKKNGSTIRTRADDPEPLKELTPEAEAAGRVIDLLVPVKSGAKEFVRTAGRRALACMAAWPPSRTAGRIGAAAWHQPRQLSTHVRRSLRFNRTAWPRPKGSHNPRHLPRECKAGWKLRRLNTAMAAAVRE
jgi:hypothetical protein